MKCLALATAALFAATAISSAAEISDGKVKIGILNDQSGVYADFGGKWSFEAAKMAAEDFGGKVLDAPIEIITADHQNKPDVASNIARQWYDTEQVDSIMELTTSSVGLAVQALSKDKKKITINTGAATTELTGKQCTPYGFHWAYDTHALAVGTGGAMVEQGGDSWFFLTADYAFGYSLEEQTGNFVKSKGGKVLGRFAIRLPRRTIRPSCYRRRHPAPRSSALPMRASTRPTPSSRRRNSASSPAGSVLQLSCSRWPKCTGWGWKQHRA